MCLERVYDILGEGEHPCLKYLPATPFIDSSAHPFAFFYSLNIPIGNIFRVVVISSKQCGEGKEEWIPCTPGVVEERKDKDGRVGKERKGRGEESGKKLIIF